MAAQRHEISLPVLKNISRASAPFERAYGKAGIRNPEPEPETEMEREPEPEPKKYNLETFLS